MSKYSVEATQQIEIEVEAETAMEALNAVNSLYIAGTLFDDKDYVSTSIKVYENKEDKNDR